MSNRLANKLKERAAQNALRQLHATQAHLIDFSSNDYLGFAKSRSIYQDTLAILERQTPNINGTTGSRLLSGNHPLFEEVEAYLCKVHEAEAALIFNAGYDANLAVLSTVPQRGDVVLFDEYSHASIRDGLRLSLAKSFKFVHNNIDDLRSKLEQHTTSANSIYVVTESIFSMDGDAPDLKAMLACMQPFGAQLILDEAHATGVIGPYGLAQAQGVQAAIFARIHTYGKAMGCHGATVLGSTLLKSFLVNFARPFIYTTGMSPFAIAAIWSSYKALENSNAHKQLIDRIQFFRAQLEAKKLSSFFIGSRSAIQSCIVSGNDRVKALAQSLKDRGFDIKAILYPTVPKNSERLRICLHAYNTEEEIMELLDVVGAFFKAEG